MLEVASKSTALTETSRTYKYVIITPAWNEASFIGLTADSMIKQSVQPIRWVVVSDGSTDGTDEIVKKYCELYDWIELLQMPQRSERHFAGKVYAFKAGYQAVKDLDFDIVGNVDADISFGEDIFEFLLHKFAEIPDLGVAGTEYTEGASAVNNYDILNIEDVTGHCQLFRRECFESIGGYLPIKDGGIDSVAVISARMKGWITRTFPERVCIHHRKVGAGQGTCLSAAYRAGKKDYYGGTHPIWMFLRSIYQIKKKPYVVGGMLLCAGYLSGVLRRAERPVSKTLIEFRRNEQMLRLKAICKRMIFPD